MDGDRWSAVKNPKRSSWQKKRSNNKIKRSEWSFGRNFNGASTVAVWKISHKNMSYKMRDVHKRKATVSSHSLGWSCDGGNSVTVHLVVFRHLKKPFLVHATLSPHSSYSQLICQQSKWDSSIKVIQQAKKNKPFCYGTVRVHAHIHTFLLTIPSAPHLLSLYIRSVQWCRNVSKNQNKKSPGKLE